MVGRRARHGSPRPLDRRGASSLDLSLLDRFELRSEGDQVPLPHGVQRVVAFLALQGRAVPRAFTAATLWLDVPDHRAAARLRSALWRLPRPGPPVVEASGTHLRLSPAVGVDAREMLAKAHRLLDPFCEDDAADIHVTHLSGELLPGWYDEWVIFERERLRQIRLHALEALCLRLVRTGLFGAAVEAAITAVAADPLRESAHRALIRVYLAEGNRAEAIHHFRRYRRLLRDELDLDPSPEIVDLVRGLPVG